MTTQQDWQRMAKTNPDIFLEQAWISLLAKEGGLEPWVVESYIVAAKADPTLAARLVQNYAAMPEAKKVLMAAFKAFPSAAETYPQWKDILPAADVQEIKGAMLRAKLFSVDDGVGNRSRPRTGGGAAL